MKFSSDMTSAAPARNHGLDTLRALAITLVFAYHYMAFVSRQPTFGWVSVVGWVGVDLFFVLSGYLIANQLFECLVRGQQVSLKRFYARRALRTLPVFWVVLAAYFLWPTLMGGKTPPPLWRFLSFTQNYQLQPGTAFSHAWSLCIEEQFYLVFPLVLVIGARLRSGVSKGWALLVALMLLGITARAVLWLQYGRESSGQLSGYHPNIYYATLCRFDEFLPGVAVAMLKNFHANAWARWMQRGQALLAWGGAAVLAMLFCVYNFYEFDGYGYGFFMTAFGYSMVAMAFAVLVAAALSPSSWLHRVRVPGAYQLALWSYSIYLSHKAIAFILQTQSKAAGWSYVTTLIVITAACVAGGALLYRLIEQPFMALRQRWFAGSFNQPAPVASQA
jgi:peptidoglycan/LPS O-acetylase OafA/YrhL